MILYEVQLQEIGALNVVKIRFWAKDRADADRLAKLRVEGSRMWILRITEVKDETVSGIGDSDFE